mmetsp:Transcript_35724/g.85555  ORF Transcript_35724/g.85555 Transcript_35724/m.85555 type:complete len:205 (-) Transcript_35724:45-659(-)
MATSIVQEPLSHQLVRHGPREVAGKDRRRRLRAVLVRAIGAQNHPCACFVMIRREDSLLGLAKQAHHVTFKLWVPAANALMWTGLAAHACRVTEVRAGIKEIGGETATKTVLVNRYSKRNSWAKAWCVDQDVEEAAPSLRKVDPCQGQGLRVPSASEKSQLLLEQFQMLQTRFTSVTNVTRPERQNSQKARGQEPRGPSHGHDP